MDPIADRSLILCSRKHEWGYAVFGGGLCAWTEMQAGDAFGGWVAAFRPG